MRFTVLFFAFLALGATIIMQAATRKVDFTDDAVGQPPKGFEFGHTAKVGAPGKWVIQAEGANKYLAQVDPNNTRSRFPVAVVSDVTAADVDLSVRFKPVSAVLIRLRASCGAFRTKTTTTSSGRTRSRTTWCCTRSKRANVPIYR